MGTVKKNFLYNTVLTVSNIFFPIISFPYVSRILGPDGIGKVQFITNFVQYFILVAGMGIPIYGIREVAKRKDNEAELKKFITQLVALNILACVILFLIFSILVMCIPFFSKDLNYYFIAGLMLFLSFCNVDWLFSGLEKFRFIAVRSIVVKIFSLIFLFFFVTNGADDLHYLWITVAANVANNIWNMRSARPYLKKSFDLYGCRKHFKPLLYIFSTVAAISIYALLDTIVLGFLTNDRAVGLYTAASKINKIVIPILTSLGTVLIPQISLAFKKNNLSEVKRLANFSLDFVLLAGIPMTMGLIVVAPELIMLFSGAKFSPAISTMQIFAPVVLIIALSNVWALQVLTPAGKDRYVTIAVTIGVFFNLIFNFLFIHLFSYKGAAIANVLTEIIVMVFFIFFTKKVIHIGFNFRLFFQCMLISSLFFPIAIFCRKVFNNSLFYTFFFTVFFSGAIYLVVQLYVFKNAILSEYKGNLVNKLKVRWKI